MTMHFRPDRRARYLVISALMYACIARMVGDIEGGAATLVLGAMLPLRVWAGVWMMVAIFAAVSAFTRYADRWAFGLLSFMALIWAVGLGLGHALENTLVEVVGYPIILVCIAVLHNEVASARLESTSSADD